MGKLNEIVYKYFRKENLLKKHKRASAKTLNIENFYLGHSILHYYWEKVIMNFGTGMFCTNLFCRRYN